MGTIMKSKMMLVVMVLGVFCSWGYSATIIVRADGSGDYPTIQAAVDAAVDGDEVVCADGVYTGAGNVNIRSRNKSITIRGENGPENCIVDCKGLGYGFKLSSYYEDEHVFLKGFTIKNGLSINTGSAIYCECWNVTIDNCIIKDCTTNSGWGEGGAIFSSCRNITISNCKIIDNINCGIYFAEDTVGAIKNCIISGNSTAKRGGGIFLDEDVSASIENCVISGNSCSLSGGGVYCGSRTEPVFMKCVISGNSCSLSGGGVYCSSWTEPVFMNCVISGNSAKGGSEAEGGGIWSGRGDLKISNSTIMSNFASGAGGGIYCYNGEDLEMTHTILWGNEDIESERVQDAQITINKIYSIDVTYNCIEDEDSNDSKIPFERYEEPHFNIDDDPCLVSLGHWVDANDANIIVEPNYPWALWVGGDFHLKALSPCIDVGEIDSMVSGIADIDGEPRVIGRKIDIGADEYARVTMVTKPEAGDVWSAGSSHEVKWESWGIVGLVDILFSTDGGGSQEAIGTGVVDSGRFMWGLPEGVDSNNCVVSVVPTVPDSSVVCIDSGPFTIQPYRRRPTVPSGHTMEGKDKGPVELDEVKWQFETDGPVTAGVGIAHNNRVHIASEDGRLYTVDADGELLWIYDANSPLVSKPAAGHFGEVYVGSEGGRLYAIDEKGKLMWTHRTGGPIYAAAAISRDGKIFVGSVDGMLWALGLDGSELWSFAVDGPGLVEAGSIFASPVIADDGTVYVGGLYDPNLYALNPADGSVKWACRFEGEFEFYSPSGGEQTFISKSCWPFASPAIGADGTIYQTLLYDNELYSIDPDDGSINRATNLGGAPVWNYVSGSGWVVDIWYGVGEPPAELGTWYGDRWRHSDGWSEPVAGAEGAVYVSFDDDAHVRGVEPNGNLMWMKEVGTSGGLMMTGSSEGHIYASAEDPNLYMIDAEGEVVGQFGGGSSLNHPVIASGRKVVVSDANNAVWMIGEDEAEEGTADTVMEKKSSKK